MIEHGNKKTLNSGDKYGGLLVICSAGMYKGRMHSWFVCSCGKLSKIRNDIVRRGQTIKCINHHSKYTGTPEYISWQAMKQRCLNSHHTSYKYYGGRGIKICDRWNTSFWNFIEDMGNRPEGMTLDRIDVNGDYCKGNCRWADIYIQANNRRNNRNITYNGKTKSINAWEMELGFSRNTLSYRLNSGWDVEKSFTTPSQIKRRK